MVLYFSFIHKLIILTKVKKIQIVKKMSADQDMERVGAFVNSVVEINNFFSFALEEYDVARYCDRAIQILRGMLNSSADHQLRVIKLLDRVKTKFEDHDAVLPVVSELKTLKDKLEFYGTAIDYITYRCYINDEDFMDYEFDYPRVLKRLQELALNENYKTCLAEFVAKVKTLDRSRGPNNTSSFWYHMDN